MPKKKDQRKAYRGPNYARDPRLRHAPVGPWNPGGHLTTGIGPGTHFDDMISASRPTVTISGPSNRVIRTGKWGAGGAVGLAGVEVFRRNRKVKKMDVSKNADLPFKGVRTFAAPKGTKKPGQLPFWEHYTNPSASPRQLGVQRFTGTKGNRTGKLVVIGKRDSDSPGFMERTRRYHDVKPYGRTAKEVLRDEAKWGGAGAAAGGALGALGGAALMRTSGGRQAMKEGAKRRFVMGNGAMQGGLLGGATGAAIGGNVSLFRDSKERNRLMEEKYGHDKRGRVKKADIIPTRVTSVQPRLPNGKWVGRANDLQVFTPQNKGKGRRIHSSALEHYTRTGVRKDLFGGGTETTLALSGTIGMGSFAQNQGRRGQRF